MGHGSPDERQISADAALMGAVAVGDQSAFVRLAAGETPRLLRFATGVLGNAAEAEEVVQEAFLRLWQHAPEWRPVARIGTWLHQIAYRLSVDRLRRRHPQVDLDDMLDRLTDPAVLPDQKLVAEQRDRQLAAAVAALPERQRAAVLLAHHQGLSQSEAAAAMDVSEAAYESLLARGRRSLRGTMAAWSAEGVTPAENSRCRNEFAKVRR